MYIVIWNSSVAVAHREGLDVGFVGRLAVTDLINQ